MRCSRSILTKLPIAIQCIPLLTHTPTPRFTCSVTINRCNARKRFIHGLLDVGCGNGIFTLRFANAGATVTGLDYSRHLLSQNVHPGLVCGDATSLPFPDRSFDVVFEANLLHHVSDREHVIGEMARASR